MKAVFVLIVAAILAWLYTKFLDRATGEEMMGCGVFVIVPYVAIIIGTIVALVLWS